MGKVHENKGWIPLEDVFSAYYECRRNKRNTANALKFELDYETNLVRLWKDINLRRYTIGRSICFLVTRPKLREVFAADFRDRIVHHIIMMRLEPLFERLFINGTYSCRKGKGTLYGVRDLDAQIKEKTEGGTVPCFVGKFDMKGFFMTIHKPTLLKMLMSFVDGRYDGDDKDTLKYLITKVVMNRPQDNCIRQSPPSMWRFLPKNKSLFTCGEEYGLPIGDMCRFLCDNLHVTLHPDKVYIQDTRNGVKFIGGVVKPNRMYVANRTVANAFGAVHRMNGQISAENAEKFMQTMNSYFGFMKHYRSYRIKKRLLALVGRGWWEFVRYNKNRGIISVRR